MARETFRFKFDSVRDSGGGVKCVVLTYRGDHTVPFFSDRIAPGVSQDRARYLKELNTKCEPRLSAVGLNDLDRMLIDLSLQVKAIAEQQAAERQHAKDQPPSTTTQGQLLVFDDVGPWPEPVDGADLLDSLADLIRRHAVLPEGGVDAVALWIAHTYAMDSWFESPILTVHSPAKQCGKSTLKDVVEGLVYRPLSTTNATTAALFRVIQSHKPTLLMDEAQDWINDRKSDLFAILQGAHKRTNACVLRCEENNQKQGVVTFSTWAAKMILLVGKLPDMMMDRSIVVRMRRIRDGERVLPIRSRTWIDHTRPLRERLQRFANDHGVELADLEPEHVQAPAWLKNRRLDNWLPLLAIAHMAGGDWPERARHAARALSGAETTDDTPGLALLADVKTVFDEIAPETSIPSASLVERLKAMEDRSWADWRRGQGISANWLAKQLAEFDVPAPQRIRLSATGQQLRGYFKDWFIEPWERYLNAAPRASDESSNFEVSQCHNVNNDGPKTPISKCHTATSVTLAKNAISPITTGVVTLVTDPRPESSPVLGRRPQIEGDCERFS